MIRVSLRLQIVLELETMHELEDTNIRLIILGLTGLCWQISWNVARLTHSPHVHMYVQQKVE